MVLSLMLLLLLLGSYCKASHFMGTVMTYYPKNTINGGSTVVLRSRTSFHFWQVGTPWVCFYGNCGTEISHQETIVYSESGADWLQREEISTLVSSSDLFQVWMFSGDWVYNMDYVSTWQASAVVDLRNRSDSNKPNSSPVTTILPFLRVPSNCQKDFKLLAFDPDGDDVRCRYGNASQLECFSCPQLPFLSLSSSCTLTFSPNNSSNGGVHVVQMVMEDFPQQSISLTQTGGLQAVKTKQDAISKIPVQFVVSVDPAVSSCTEGLYLPRFLSPTPANGDHLYTLVNQTLVINITAEALNSVLSELLYSGPANIITTTMAPGKYSLTWTPSQSEDGETHPICFVVQAVLFLDKYHSELRCVAVTVGKAPSSPYVVATRMKMASSTPLSQESIRITILQQVKDELVRRGIPSDVMLRLLSSEEDMDTGGLL